MKLTIEPPTTYTTKKIWVKPHKIVDLNYLEINGKTLGTTEFTLDPYDPIAPS